MIVVIRSGIAEHITGFHSDGIDQRIRITGLGGPGQVNGTTVADLQFVRRSGAVVTGDGRMVAVSQIADHIIHNTVEGEIGIGPATIGNGDGIGHVIPHLGEVVPGLGHGNGALAAFDPDNGVVGVIQHVFKTSRAAVHRCRVGDAAGIHQCTGIGRDGAGLARIDHDLDGLVVAVSVGIVGVNAQRVVGHRTGQRWRITATGVLDQYPVVHRITLQDLGGAVIESAITITHLLIQFDAGREQRHFMAAGVRSGICAEQVIGGNGIHQRAINSRHRVVILDGADITGIQGVTALTGKVTHQRVVDGLFGNG